MKSTSNGGTACPIALSGISIYGQYTNIKPMKANEAIMKVKIKSSLVDSVTKGSVYRVFCDEADDERYILDENGERVLFDKMVFKYERVDKGEQG